MPTNFDPLTPEQKAAWASSLPQKVLYEGNPTRQLTTIEFGESPPVLIDPMAPPDPSLPTFDPEAIKITWAANPVPPQHSDLLGFCKAQIAAPLQPFQKSLVETLSAPGMMVMQQEAERLLQQPRAAMRRVQFLATQRWLEKLRPTASHKVRKALQHRTRLPNGLLVKFQKKRSKAQRATERRLRFERNKGKRQRLAKCPRAWRARKVRALYLSPAEKETVLIVLRRVALGRLLIGPGMLAQLRAAAIRSSRKTSP